MNDDGVDTAAEPGSLELGTDRSVSQTLSRGLQVIEVLAEAGEPMTAQEIASALGVSRSIVYRLLRTLAQHHILNPDVAEGQFALGLGLMTLSRGVHKNLREAAHPILGELAQRTGGTAFLGVREGEEVVCVVSAEAEQAMFAVRYREGIRRPITLGASGLAIRASFPARPDDSPELKATRRAGFAVSEQTLEPNTSAVSAALQLRPGSSDCCVTIIFPSPRLSDIEAKGRLVIEAARRISASVTL